MSDLKETSLRFTLMILESFLKGVKETSLQFKVVFAGFSLNDFPEASLQPGCSWSPSLEWPPGDIPAAEVMSQSLPALG